MNDQRTSADTAGVMARRYCVTGLRDDASQEVSDPQFMNFCNKKFMFIDTPSTTGLSDGDDDSEAIVTFTPGGFA